MRDFRADESGGTTVVFALIADILMRQERSSHDR